MDPITVTASFATIVSLTADFISQRRAADDATLDEFKAWLADQRHDEVISFLESNVATTVGIKALLHESHAEILERLGQLELQIAARLEQPERVPGQEKAKIVETICLGLNNTFAGTKVDLAELATRCAIYAIEEKTVEFRVSLQETLLDAPPDDPLILPRYEKVRHDRARQLESRLELLASPAVYEWWQYFLSRKEDWEAAIQSLLARASFNGHAGGQKIDVWRTEDPKLIAAIYLNTHEVAETLAHLGFSSTSELRFGAHWRAAIDLPFDLISQHVIPSIIVQLEQHKVPVVGDALNLAAWHIGEG